jgi:hypothetical protein
VALGLAAAAPVLGAGERYRVELIVFRNLEVPAAPVEIDEIRRFHNALDLDAPTAPEAPVALEKADGAFANLWARLDRLAEYEPLVRLTFEQSLFDYHPPVRVHDESRMGEELHFPGGVAYVDLANAGARTGWFDDYVEPLYRLDGTVQLRRSRFLHVDLDLEYRLDGPAWERDFPTRVPMGLPEGFEWVGEPPATGASGPGGDPAPAEGAAEAPATTAVEEREPFRLHRLRQSRQVRTDTMQYFDSAYLGAIVRVTTIADGP